MSGVFGATGVEAADEKADGKVVSVSLSANPQKFVGRCRSAVRVTLTGTIVTSGAVNGLKVQFRFGDGTTGKALGVPARKAGTYQVHAYLYRTASWSETVQLAVLAPEPSESEKLIVSGTCEDPSQKPVVPPVPNDKAPVWPKPLYLPAQPDGSDDPIDQGRPASERFRVTATGFYVARETTEAGIFDTYGAGDEVKLVSWSCETNPSGAGRVDVRTSFEYGDASATSLALPGIAGDVPGRVQAGTARGTRNRGGLAGGNRIPEPGNRPPDRTPGRAVSGEDEDVPRHMFPTMVLWEGVLFDERSPQRNIVVLVPTLWELDITPLVAADGDAQSLSRIFGPRIERHLRSQGPAYLSMSARPGFRPVTQGDFRGANPPLIHAQWPGEFSRPIGTQWSGAGTQSWVVFEPWTLRLTLATARQIASSTAFSSSPSHVAGDVDLHFDDDEQFHGQYVLFLHVERVRR